MTTTILLIRHGQTDWNAEGRWQGHADVPLNELGRQQAQLLAGRLKAWPISAIYCSDLKRASETAAIIARELDLEPISDRQWRERDTGLFSGLTRAEIQEQYPEVWALLRQGVVDIPGAESSAALTRRAQGVLQALLERHNGETIAVVSHGGTLRAVIAEVLNIPVVETMRLRVGGNTGLSIVSIREEGHPILERLNDVAHLEYADSNYGVDGTD